MAPGNGSPTSTEAMVDGYFAPLPGGDLRLDERALRGNGAPWSNDT